jgi:hypothetical protein
MPADLLQDIMFVELSTVGVDGKAFDALAPWEGMDMYGTKVKLDGSNFAAIVANTMAAIESSKTASGELVGLPIDKTNHDHEGGAGWIVGAKLDGNKIQFVPKWTDAGAELIRSGERRFFSASIDMKNQVILGGTLCNWPAQRDQKGRYNLRPIELSSPILIPEYEENTGLAGAIADLTSFLKRVFPGKQPETQEGDNAMPIPTNQPGTLPAELAAVVNDPTKLNELIDSRAAARANDLVAAQTRKAHIAEFATKIVGGTKEVPAGLPATQAEVVELLSAVSPEVQTKLEAMLEKAANGKWLQMVEAGHGQQLASTGTKKLKPEMGKLLKEYLGRSKDNTVELFFKANANILGDQAEYNLAEFVTVKEK